VRFQESATKLHNYKLKQILDYISVAL